MDNNKTEGYDNTAPDPIVEEKAEVLIDETVIISPEKFEQLCYKAARLDILKASIERSGEVKDEVALAVTEALPNHDIEKLRKDNQSNWDYYWKEKQKTEELRERVALLEKSRNELIEILNQNKVGPYAETCGLCTEGEAE